MKLAVVTCTGLRPRMFPLCARWVSRQTRVPDLWIVSLGEDQELGNVTLPSYAKVNVWKKDEIGFGMTGEIDSNSKYQIEVMRHVPNDYAVAYFDDDDWYGPTYLERVEHELLTHGITGNGRERRYSLTLNRWMEVEKSGCNAGAVAMRHEAIADWVEWMQNKLTKWDWLACRHRTNLRNMTPRVSMKHGPGLGHLFPPLMHKWLTEGPEKWSKLREWIGEDVSVYEELMR